MRGVPVTEIAPRASLRTLCAAMILAVLPLVPHVSIAAIAVLVGVLVARMFGIAPSSGLTSTLSKAGVLVVGLGVVLAQYGGLLGLAPGVSVLVLLIALKGLEAKRPRDFHVLALLGFFLCLTLTFFSQSLTMMLFCTVVFLLLMAALAQAEGKMRFRRALAETARLAMIAVPLIVVLFLLFPRTVMGVRFHLRGSEFALSGMNDQLAPGTIASATESDAVAFRAYFLDGNLPPLSELYWRGAVLWEGRGMLWSVGAGDNPHVRAPTLGGRSIRQRIVMEPHGRHWIFALDYPVSRIPGSTMQLGDFLRSRRPAMAQKRYDVISRPDSREESLPAWVRLQALRLPDGVPPRIRELVEGWQADGADARTISARALQFFRRERFTYTLSPGTYEEASMERFLFERKAGFCEHFAASFATLMRIAGIPARVVVGYQGGEVNPGGDYVIVRQADAHAWAEVWIEGAGWKRVDPTEVVAPARLASGFDSFLETSTAEASGQPGGLTGSAGYEGLRAILGDVRLAWDNVQLQWDLYVLDYGEDAQRALFMISGVGERTVATLIWWMGGAVAAATIFSALLMGWSGQGRRDGVVQAYEVFCKQAAAAGVTRGAGEGPLNFGERVAAAFPAAEAGVRSFIQRYVEARYGGVPASEAALQRLARGLRFTRSDAARRSRG